MNADFKYMCNNISTTIGLEILESNDLKLKTNEVGLTNQVHPSLKRGKLPSRAKGKRQDILAMAIVNT